MSGNGGSGGGVTGLSVGGNLNNFKTVATFAVWDGRSRIYVGAADGSVHALECSPTSLVSAKRFKAGIAAITSVFLLEMGPGAPAKVVATDSDGAVRAWSIRGGPSLDTALLYPKGSHFSVVQITPGMIAAAGPVEVQGPSVPASAKLSTLVRIFDDTFTPFMRLQGAGERPAELLLEGFEMASMVSDKSGCLALGGSSGGRIVCITGLELRVIGEFQAHTGAVTALAFGAAETRDLVSGGADRKLKIWTTVFEPQASRPGSRSMSDNGHGEFSWQPQLVAETILDSLIESIVSEETMIFASLR